MIKKLTGKTLSIIFLLNLMISFSGCQRNYSEINRSGTYFDTIITITLYDKDQSSYLDGCMKLAEKYENYFSTTIPTSDIAKINSSAGSPVEVHQDTIDIIKKSIKYSEMTDGRFDITIGKLSSLWQEAIKTKTVPDADAIESARQTVDYKNINISGKSVRIAPGQAIDLGGIAKGYIADKMASYLKKHGVKSALINLGGNVYCINEKPDGSKYNVGIKKPFSKSGEVASSVECANTSVVTSGTYERYFKKNGIIYHHIIDLTTGYPCQNKFDSVTIISKNSTDGDALSTSLFLLSKKDIKKFIRNHNDIEVRIVAKDGNIETIRK